MLTGSPDTKKRHKVIQESNSHVGDISPVIAGFHFYGIRQNLPCFLTLDDLRQFYSLKVQYYEKIKGFQVFVFRSHSFNFFIVLHFETVKLRSSNGRICEKAEPQIMHRCLITPSSLLGQNTEHSQVKGEEFTLLPLCRHFSPQLADCKAG